MGKGLFSLSFFELDLYTLDNVPLVITQPCKSLYYCCILCQNDVTPSVISYTIYMFRYFSGIPIFKRLFQEASVMDNNTVEIGDMIILSDMSPMLGSSSASKETWDYTPFVMGLHDRH